MDGLLSGTADNGISQYGDPKNETVERTRLHGSDAGRAETLLTASQLPVDATIKANGTKYDGTRRLMLSPVCLWMPGKLSNISVR
ncbi:hypothetical protein HHL24_42915 [Paraburkholderia sp. RP-4-7]|uniref:Uncharacterized protein n=1 Tax=Paraburkholderia polaris TaxID=2728848 RepID=A0A848ITP4_9BURK|nr:hypothetical protein [Paraburkholderia polaris]NMM04570.1 hypothetical protein [Paraburkholderia polaris]